MLLKYFNYKTKLLENIFADGVNAILKNIKIGVPLEYPSNFWRSQEMLLINCKVKLKIKWTKYCVLSSAGADDANGNSNNIIFTIKNTKLNVSVVNLSAKDKQKTIKTS